MKELILFRGITVPADNAEIVRREILTEGIRGDEGSWNIEIVDLKDRLQILYDKADLTTNDTRPSRTVQDGRGWHIETIDGFRIICACGDESGASYYALDHNRHPQKDEISFIIKFVVPLSDVYIDGKDFLYTCFQFWDRKGTGIFASQSETLSKLFGKTILKYFEKAASTDDQKYRVAMCDLACQDDQIISDHAKNKIIIKGRYNTTFCSAFFVKSPIAAARILSVEIPAFINLKVEEIVQLDNF